MRIIHVVHGKANPNEHNGISRVVYNLNKHERALGIDSQIWAIVNGTRSRYSHRRDEYVTVECFPRVWIPWGRHQIVEDLLKERQSIDLVHFHLIWFYDKNVIARSLKRAGLPFIITTHGTYSTPTAYTGKRAVARALFERDYLNMATEIHAVTREEGTGLMRFGFKGRCFVVPNGVDLSEATLDSGASALQATTEKQVLTFLWVGVLREDKNVPALIRAVALLPEPLRARLRFVLVGPDYRGSLERYRELASRLGCGDRFEFRGPLYGAAKHQVIQQADAYVMPSHTEVLSLAVLDAMAYAKPCLVTSGCGFNYYVSSDAFVRCEPYPQDIARGLDEIVSRRAEWPQMGLRARALAELHFSWPRIAASMIEQYRRIAAERGGGGSGAVR